MKISLSRKHLLKYLLRTLKHTYIGLHYVLISTILVTAAFLYIAYRADGLSLLNTYVLKPLGVRSTYFQGSLSEGFSLHNLHSKAIDAKTLTLDYNLTSILKGEHVIDAITIDGLRIHLDDFVGDTGSALPLPLFKIKEVTLSNVQLISSYPIELNFHGENGSYDGENLSFASVQSTIKSRYASGALQGRMTHNSLRGTALVYPNAAELKSTAGRFTTLPSVQRIHIDELSPTRAKLHTVFDQLSLLSDPLTSAHAIALDMDYRYEDDYLNFKSDYLLARDGQKMQTHQELRYTLDSVTTSTFTGEITTALPLSSKRVIGEFRDDAQGISGKLTLENTILLLQSHDYDSFKWDLTSVQKDLNHLEFLPVALQQSSFSVSASGSYMLEKNQLDGTFSTKHAYGDTNGSLHYNNEAFSLDLHGQKGTLSLTYADKKLQGSGYLLGTNIQLDGSYGNKESDLTITTFTPSLWKALSSLDSIKLPEGEYYDAQVQTTTHILYDTALHVSTEISVPWYAAVLDSQRQYAGTNNTLLARYSDHTIFIDNYRLNIAGHDISSQRLSRAHINDAGNLLIDELWIFDALRLSGEINPSTLSSQLSLHSDRFTYKGPEGQADAAMDLLFTRDSQAVQTLSGNVEILNADITYLPLQQFKVMDNDVIIIQDVRPPSNTSLFINVQISAKEPLHYHTKELDVFVQPELTIWKEPTGKIQLLGMVTIPKGSATTSNKEFAIQPSHLYFSGGESINPYLDFTIAHEVDYKKIHIYITHRLDSPIFLFSSDPFMSQNDIMSYLLFGSPADASLNTDGSKTAVKTDATNFMLGAGVKGLINGATKIQIDTMNILTTQEGGMGIEVGTHLNKDLRVLYKNDTVSSILVQYQLNRWLRLDADVHELGQGINAIYIKDFHDFLPHNSVQKQ